MTINFHPIDRVLTFFSILYPIDVWDYQRDFICFANLSLWFFPAFYQFSHSEILLF